MKTSILFILFLTILACQVGAPLPTGTVLPPVSPNAPALPAIVFTSTGAPEAVSTPLPAATAAATVTAIPTRVPTTRPTEDYQDFGKPAYEYLKALSENIGARLAGTGGEKKAAKTITADLTRMGYKPQSIPFSYSNEDEERLTAANILAVKPGTSPRVIIVGAHYDSAAEGRGADDNASGVAVLLETAGRVFDAPTPYTIYFIAFDAEENDLDGSRAYASAMSTDNIRDTVAMINLDGLIAGNVAYVYGDSDLRDWVLDVAHGSSFALDTQPVEDLDAPDGTPCDCADYGPFQEIGVPFIFFEAANWAARDEAGEPLQVDRRYGEDGLIRHTPDDTITYINHTFPGRIEDHLHLYATLLYRILTEYRVQ